MLAVTVRARGAMASFDWGAMASFDCQLYLVHKFLRGKESTIILDVSKIFSMIRS